MLQRNMLQTETARSPLMTRSDQTGGGGIGEMVNFAMGLLRRQYLVITLTVVLAISISLVYLRVTPPTYTARVQILLENSKAQFVQQQSLLADPTIDLSQIETQLQILKSSAIAASVIKQLRLNDDPDLNSPAPSFFSLWYRLRTKVWPRPEQPQIGESGQSDQPPEAVMRAFQDRLSANRVSFSNVLEVTFNSSGAARAAEIANATAKAYIDDQLNAKFEANRSATSWLQDRLRNLGEQALLAERAVGAYKTQNNIVSSGGKSIDDQQITDLNSRLVAARAQTSDAASKLNRYETVLRANAQGSTTIGAPDAGGNDALNSPIINNLRQQYLELARRESEWSTRFGRDHLAVINLQTRMRDLSASILDEFKRLGEASRNEYETAKQRQQEIEKQLAEAVSQSHTTNSAELTIRELESRAKGLRSLYETFLQRYMGSVQQETFPISETRVIYPATPPQSKSKPKTALVMALGLIGGLALGVGLGLLRDLMDRVFRTSTQIEGMLELPCLSLVPLQQCNTPTKRSSFKQTDDDLRQRKISTAPAVHHAVVETPLSRYAEAIRSIKLAIDLSANRRSCQVIGITSAVPNEGKTTIAAALAQLIGHSGKKVIVVDCDLRNPSLSASLTPNATTGILEVMNGTRTIDETVWHDPRTSLLVLPVVKRGPLFHTSEHLASESMLRLFETLRESYDYVIVDLPPLAPLIDVRSTSQFIDSFLLVVEWGRSKIDVVQHALHTAPNIYECMIGAILNKTDIKAMMRYDTYRSDYYSDTHYERYGFSD